MNPLILNSNPALDSKIIVALDYNDSKDVYELVAKLSPELCKLKIGKELFTSCGPDLVRNLVNQGYKVFLDLKFHDIPNTVASAVKSACDLGVWMVNVHASGGSKMLDAAVNAVKQNNYDTLLIAVTILTSMSEADYLALGYAEPKIVDKVVNMAKLSYASGVDGVVCSAFEAADVKNNTCKQFLCVTPGIRLASDSKDDQARIMTPPSAIISGADYLVMGRSIVKSNDPISLLRDINKSILEVNYAPNK